MLRNRLTNIREQEKQLTIREDKLQQENKELSKEKEKFLKTMTLLTDLVDQNKSARVNKWIDEPQGRNEVINTLLLHPKLICELLAIVSTNHKPEYDTIITVMKKICQTIIDSPSRSDTSSSATGVSG